MQDEKIDPYINRLMQIVGIYSSKEWVGDDDKVLRDNKEIIMGMIGKFKVVSSVLNEVYLYLVRLKEIDPIDDESSETRAMYLLEII